MRLVGGFLGFEIGSQDVDAALLLIEVGGAHSKRFPGLQLVERQATDCGDELLAAVGLIEAVQPNLRGSPCERAAGRRDDPVRWSANRAAFVVFGAFDARPYSKRPWRGL